MLGMTEVDHLHVVAAGRGLCQRALQHLVDVDSVLLLERVDHRAQVARLRRRVDRELPFASAALNKLGSSDRHQRSRPPPRTETETPLKSTSAPRSKMGHHGVAELAEQSDAIGWVNENMTTADPATQAAVPRCARVLVSGDSSLPPSLTLDFVLHPSRESNRGADFFVMRDDQRR